jgi:hypothetical protein
MLAESPHVDMEPLSSKRRRNEWLLLGLTMLVLTTGVAAVVFEDRASITLLERNRLQTQARVIEENLVRQLQAVSSVLAGLRFDLVSGDDDRDGNTERPPLRLKTLNDALPGVRAIYAVDRNGMVVNAEQKSYIGRSARGPAVFHRAARTARRLADVCVAALSVHRWATTW